MAGTSLVHPVPAHASSPPDSLDDYHTTNFSHCTSPSPNAVYLPTRRRTTTHFTRLRLTTPSDRSHRTLVTTLARAISLLRGVMNPKNWNDRADKDLFFTILSVKNIGIISGGEWTTIGNHMRSMGYGFTNEGCRQHFQGLRRSQNKADAKAAATDVVCRDPTLNPITRRPGPGRGRPRKLPAGSEGESPVDGAISPVAAHVPSAMPTPGTTQQSETPDQQEAQRQPPPPGKPDAVSATVPEAASLPTDVLTAAAAAVAATTDAAAHGSPREDGDAEADDDGTEKHPAKRQRLDTQEPEPGPEPEPEPEQPLDDEAILALAAHNGAAGTDYAEDLSYGEA